MPYINVQVTRTLTEEQKRGVVQDITESVVNRLGKAPEHVHIVLQVVGAENWGYAGQLVSETNADLPARES